MAIAAHRRLTARYAMSNAAYGLTAVARPADKPAMRSGFWERANAHTTASEASITNVLIWPSRSSCSRYLARISVDSKGTSGPRTSGSKRSVSVSVPANAAMDSANQSALAASIGSAAKGRYTAADDGKYLNM